MLSLRGQKRQRDRGHVTRPAGVHVREAAGDRPDPYLLYEIQGPVPVVVAGQHVGALEPKGRDVSVPSEQRALGGLRPLPASPSPSFGRRSGPCPLPPSSRRRGPPSGRPRRHPEPERGPASSSQSGGAGVGPQESSLE